MKGLTEILIMAALLAGLSSCKSRGVINGTLDTLPKGDVGLLLKSQSNQGMKVVDSARVSSDGKFRFKVGLRKGQPDFYYIYRGDDKLASLILENGSRVKVVCDTLGNWTVEGSADCDSLRVWERMFSRYLASSPLTADRELSFHRHAVTFVLGNSTSLCVVPVLFARIGDGGLFSRSSDAFLFARIADSLQTRYPESRYVGMLRDEAERRRKIMDFDEKLAAASTRDFPELAYPDINGRNVSLTESVSAKTLLVFWDASDASHKIFNQDVLKPLYQEFAPWGLSIYAVGLGADKATWAGVVRSQDLPWTNVCDVRGTSAVLYALTQLPTIFVIDGNGINRIGDVTKLKSIFNR